MWKRRRESERKGEIKKHKKCICERERKGDALGEQER